MSELTKRKKTARIHEGNPLITVLLYATCIMLCFLCLYPMWYVLCCSLSQGNYVDAQQVWWIPRGFTLHAYKLIFMENDMWRAYANTIVYVIGATLLQLVFCMLAAYPLTCKNMIGRKVITTFFLIPMYFGAGLIPTFLTYRAYGLMNNFLVYILPAAISAFNVLVMRSFIDGLPYELIESAKIDGASEYRILFGIIFPLSMPVIATIGLFVCVSQWNQWFDTMMYCSSEKELITLQYKLKQVLDTANSMTGDSVTMDAAASVATEGSGRVTTQTIRAAMTVISVVPIACVYPFLQKYFVKGMTLGAVKG